MADYSDIIKDFKFNREGLICAVAQSHDTNRVLMVAWMNAEAVRLTLESKRVWYWSRSRKKLWRKGEQSGNNQSLVEMHLDCDGDTLLLKVKQEGPACHTGNTSCFFKGIFPF